MRVTYHLAVIVSIALTSPARADDYRVEVGAADAVSAVAFTIAVRDLDSRPGLIVGVTSFASMALTAPIMHAVHENYDAMGYSLGARVLFPAIGLYVGIKTQVSERTVLGGFMTGFLIASIIDVALGSQEDPATSARMLSIGGRF